MRSLARIGSLARAFVYFLMGTFALMVAMGNPYGKTTDSIGILRQLLDEQTFGRMILVILAGGLFCYAIWRVSQGVQDHDFYGRSLRGLAVRFGFGFSGLAYAGLGVYALALAMGSGSDGSEGASPKLNEKIMARWILTLPLGRFVLMALGGIVIATGFVQFVHAFAATFLRDIELPQRQGPLIKSVCRAGFLARGITFVILGAFVFSAGWKSRSREVGGLHKAWETLRSQPFGDYLLGAVALGFIAFSLFGFVEGFFRKR